MNWTLAQLLFLMRFRITGAADSDPLSPRAQSWKVALRESEEDTLKRFIAAGLLVQFPLVESVAYSFSAVSLREMLRSRSLTRSGTKLAMAKRLCVADEASMSGLAKSAPLWRCNDAGRRLAEEFDRRQQRMQSSALEAMRAHDFHRAVARVEAFDAEVGFPKDPVFTMPTDTRKQVLSEIFNAKPRILGKIDDETLEELRLTAGMETLGCEKFRPAKNLNVHVKLGPVVATRMIGFLARHRVYLRHTRAIGIRRVELLAGSDSCDSCARLVGRSWEINDAPEIPNPECTSSLDVVVRWSRIGAVLLPELVMCTHGSCGTLE